MANSLLNNPNPTKLNSLPLKKEQQVEQLALLEEIICDLKLLIGDNVPQSSTLVTTDREKLNQAVIYHLKGLSFEDNILYLGISARRRCCVPKRIPILDIKNENYVLL